VGGPGYCRWKETDEIQSELDMSTKGMIRKPYRRRIRMARSFRRLAPLIAGIALQTTATSCEQQLTTLANSLSQDLVDGIGAGLGNLLQALMLNLFV
jgi:hypothetical protein